MIEGNKSFHDSIVIQKFFLGAWSLVPSDIAYETKMNSRTVQREGGGARARQDGGISDGGIDTLGQAQGGRGPMLNREAVLAGILRQVYK